jgi:acetyl esterase
MQGAMTEIPPWADPALDRDAAWVVEKAAKTKLPPFEVQRAAAARAQYAVGAHILALPPAPMEAVEDRAVPGPAGPVPVRLYVPAFTGVADPLLVYLHGGGWTVGSIETHDRVARQLAALAGVRVLSVEYRLAPEHPYPAGLEDAEAAWRAVAADPAAFGADPARLAVGGDSAGGSLSAALCQRARDRGLARPRLQLLLYPSCDLVGDYASRRRFAAGYLLTDTVISWFVDNYVPDPARRGEAGASPLRAASLAGLPPAHIQTAGFDPIQDEGTAYARALAAAGVAVEHVHYPGLIHSYAQLAGRIRAARPALAKAAAALRRALA